MNIRLRTVIFLSKVEIENVPIYSCESCKHSEVFAQVKQDLKQLIGTCEGTQEKQTMQFNEWNELANVLYIVSDKEHTRLTVKEIIDERINELLDLLLIAQASGDQIWIHEIRQKLSQISNHSLNEKDLIG